MFRIPDDTLCLKLRILLIVHEDAFIKKPIEIDILKERIRVEIIKS
jgi:hypothetical protein